MPKNLIVCCDGTWSNPEQENNGVTTPTNVVKLYNAVAETGGSGIRQMKYYHPGVGGEDIGLIPRISGGAFGLGISRHIQSAYHWIASNYEEGDNLFLFGFSRGAFTARSLAGFIGKGLLDLRGIKYDDESWKRVKIAYEKAYRGNRSVKEVAAADWVLFAKGEAVAINFLGVWDTVGALGIPDDLELLNLFDRGENWGFHDTELGSHIKHARHAMAIDEWRACFTVTRWHNADSHADAREVWFPGTHSDVGGGYVETGLSNIALEWMMKESGKCGLEFRPGLKINVDPCGVIHNSYRGFFAKLRSRPRNFPAIEKANGSLFHPSVFTRQEKSPLEYPAYHPLKKLGVDEFCTVEIFADKHWNETNLYLEAGQEYLFSAAGKWLDSKDSCDWNGAQNEEFTTGDVIRGIYSFWGQFEKVFRKIAKNPSTDFWGTKRVEPFKWFVMTGAIANDGGDWKEVKNDGSPHPHQYIEIPKFASSPFVVGTPGYLYCFANDAWCFYGNNHGSIELTVSRVK